MARNYSLKDLSDDDLIQAQSAVDRSLCAVLKINTTKPTMATERRMVKAMTKAWKDAARRGLVEPLRDLLSNPVTGASIASFVSRLGIKLAKPLTKRQTRLLAKRLRVIYRSAKELGSKEASGSFVFRQVDQRALNAINKQQVFWVGNFYSEHLSVRIQAVTEDVMIKQGLPQREAGVILRQAIKQEFGLKSGGASSYAPNVPARYAGNPDFYFRQVGATAAHQSRTFGKIQAFDEADIIRYKLLNPNDKRTGTICQHMNGQVFTVSAGVKHMNAILDAEDPQDVKNIAPWLSGEKVGNALDDARTGSKDAADRLEELGAVLPPFHALCRTEPVVLS